MIDKPPRNSLPEYLTAFALLVAVFPWPYGYFVLLRWVTAALAAYLSYEAWNESRSGWAWIWMTVALLFNPIVPVHLGRVIWIAVDIGVAALLIGSVESRKRHKVVNQTIR